MNTKKFWKRCIAFLMCVCTVATLFVGCGDTGESTETTGNNDSVVSNDNTVTKDTLKIAIPSKLSSLDILNGQYSGNAAIQVFDQLFESTTDLGLAPMLAESVEWVDNDLTWEFKLRQGVKFHDGSDFTADDAIYSMMYFAGQDCITKYQSEWQGHWPISCEKIDDYTFRATTTGRWPSFIKYISRIPMIPENLAGMTDEEFWAKPIGTGPYIVDTYELGVSVSMTANENYWQGAPKIQKLYFESITDEDARIAAFKSGEFDIAMNIPFNQIETIDAMDGVHIQESDSVGFNFLMFNFNSEATAVADPLIRKAITYAIDHQAIYDVIMKGYAESASGPQPMILPNAYDGGGFPERDLDKVAELLEEANYDGQEIRFVMCPGEFPSDVEACEAIAAMLEEAGFNVKFSEYDSLTFNDVTKSGEWDICNNGQPGAAAGEPIYHYTQIRKKYSYTNENVEALLVEIEQNEDLTDEERGELMTECMKYVWEDTPYAMAFTTSLYIAVNDSVQGLETFPIRLIRLDNAYFE